MKLNWHLLAKANLRSNCDTVPLPQKWHHLWTAPNCRSSTHRHICIWSLKGYIPTPQEIHSDGFWDDHILLLPIDVLTCTSVCSVARLAMMMMYHPSQHHISHWEGYVMTWIGTNLETSADRQGFHKVKWANNLFYEKNLFSCHQSLCQTIA